MDQLPRLGKRELICLLSFTCNYVVFVWRGFLFLWVLGMGYVILLWHSLSLPYNYFHLKIIIFTAVKYCCILHGRVCVMSILISLLEKFVCHTLVSSIKARHMTTHSSKPDKQ